MFCPERYLVLLVVTVFSYSRYTGCASLTSNIGAAANWASRSTNHTERQGRQHQQLHSSISSINFSSGNNKASNNNNLRRDDSANFNEGVDSQSSYSITPSFSYEFHTNDHEHLNRIVSAHQNSPSNGIAGGGAGITDGGAAIKTGSIRVGENIPLSDSAKLETVSAERRSDLLAVTDLPRTSTSYPGFDFSAYQSQNHVWSNTQHQQSGGWKEGKHDQQWQQQQNQLVSDPTAVSQEKYLSQNGEAGELQDNATRIPNPSSPLYLRQPTTIKSEEIRNNSTVHVYSRLPKNQQTSNGTPITYQGQQQQQNQQIHTAASYSYRDTNNGKHEADVSTARSMPAVVQVTPAAFGFPAGRRPGGEKRKILQSREDTYAPADDGAVVGQEEDDDEHTHYYDHGDEQYAQGQGEAYEHDHDHDHGDDNTQNDYYYGNAVSSQYGAPAIDPALRDFGGKPGEGGPLLSGPGGPGGPPGFGGPPLLPPGPLKGSIDYILIPLILIGLAGPIFVVLYVVLGGFEYRLAPITRSLKSSYADYQSYIDTAASSVGRALEKYECPDYAACRVRGFYKQLGLQSSTTNTIEMALSSVTPKEYMSTLKSVFSILTNETAEADCSRYKCFSMVNKLPVKF